MLSVGTKLGPYEIESQAGVGGMGEVYKAKDTRLDRSVAIKVLSVQIASNPDLRQRFDREAKAISSLNHPNICTLHDIGSQGGVDFLVMEYLDGETLASKLTKGPLPIPELLTISVQIADALDKAHKQGLVHRDLKPGNIMLTKGGAKLMDFGLAKLTESSLIQGASGITRTTPLTGEGTIIGTLQYMSPEQLEGKEADFRSDIFSFGVILYEMATGHRAFEGRSQASLIAAILKETPRPVTEIQPMSPPMLDRVIKQCMEKDPEHRWQSAGDLKRALQWTLEGGSQVGIPISVSTRRKLREKVLWASVVLLGGAAITLGVLQLTKTEPKPKVARFSIPAPEKVSGITWPKISPDGTTIAFQGTDSSGQRGIYIRPMNSLESHFLVKIAGDNSRPFWSPDSKQFAYFESGHLKKISIAGGLAQIVCEANGADGAWGSSGIIVFDGSITDSIRQVPASGGVPTAASRINREKNERMSAWPTFLPDGEHFLFLADSTGASGEWNLKLGSIKSLETKDLTRVNSRVEYANGYILYMRRDLLMAHPFDPEKLEFTGEPVPLSPNVSYASERALFGVSDEGTLVFRKGNVGGNRSIISINRKGDSLTEIAPPAQYADIRISPDNNRLAYSIITDQLSGADVWVRDLKRNIASRLTFGAGLNTWPVWSPDGSMIYYGTNRKSGRFFQMKKNSNGTGAEDTVCVVDTADVGITSISSDGTMAVLIGGTASVDIFKMKLPDGKPEPLLVESYQEMRGAISPDGKYLAYQSTETGENEVYLRELQGGGKWQVSVNGGRCPLWKGDGKEIYYSSPNFDLMEVPISYAGGVEIGTPTKLFTQRFFIQGTNTLNSYAVTNDGQKFYFLSPTEEGVAAEFIVVQNWPEELKK